MSRLSDTAIARLRRIAEKPELTGTHYEIAGELGRGGMGVVYEVHDLDLGRHVAMKVMATEHASRADECTLPAEARVIAALEHPGIVPVYASGTLPDGRSFYTMKLVRGRRLERWCEENHATVERLRLFARICEPLAFAHSRGIVHGDVKPGNIMVGEFGEVLVMDWGAMRGPAGRPGSVVGTPGFMAPEQEQTGALSPQCDVFALGRLLSNMLEGQKEPPRRLAAIIARATAAEAGARYENARPLMHDVQRYLDGDEVLAYRESPIERTARWISRNRVVVSLLVAYLLMRIAVYLWMRI